MKETVLLFHNLDRQELLKIEMALFPLKVRLRSIQKSDYLQPLGALAGVPDCPRIDTVYEGEALPETMIVFAFFNNARLDAALLALRRSKAGPFPYKAVLTETNRSWNAIDCLRELMRERDAIEAAKKEPPKHKNN